MESKLKMVNFLKEDEFNRSYPEHEKLDPENGCYSHTCRGCGQTFYAHKHFYIKLCKLCNKEN